MIRRTTNSQRRPKLEPEVRNSRMRAQAISRPLARANVAAPAPIAGKESKTALVTRLLSLPSGASLEELVAATSWQPHTIRAALTALRKKGLTIARGKVEGVTRYTIASALAKPGASRMRRAAR